MFKLSESLSELHLELPPVPKAVASYIPARKDGDKVYVSGQLPFLNVILWQQGS